MPPQAPFKQNTTQGSRASPIGIFDSGIGGLSIYRALRAHLPDETLYYLADQNHVPYGSRSLAEIRRLSTRITQFLLSRQAKLIVVACNTASAAALTALRATFPNIPFVGMEPAVKPAAFSTQSGRIGVLATPGTFRGASYGSLLDRFAQKVIVLEDTCPGLVKQIEAGDWEGPVTRKILEAALAPMLDQGVDRIVLGCTHYPLVIPLIEDITGPGVQVIDPAPAIAQQAARLLTERGMLNPGRVQRSDRFWTTADPIQLLKVLPAALQESFTAAEGGTLFSSGDRRIQVEGLTWDRNEFIKAI